MDDIFQYYFTKGIIHNQPLMDIWHSQKYVELRENILNQDIYNIPDVCKDCPLYSEEYYSYFINIIVYYPYIY